MFRMKAKIFYSVYMFQAKAFNIVLGVTVDLSKRKLEHSVTLLWCVRSPQL